MAPLEDPAIAFTIGLQSQAIRNAWALKTGSGLVRSEFDIEGPPGSTVEVFTAIRPDRRFTILALRVPRPNPPAAR